MTVQTTLLANQGSVSIHVQLLTSALLMPTAELPGIRLYALVLMVILVLPKFHVHYVSVCFIVLKCFVSVHIIYSTLIVDKVALHTFQGITNYIYTHSRWYGISGYWLNAKSLSETFYVSFQKIACSNLVYLWFLSSRFLEQCCSWQNSHEVWALIWTLELLIF